MTSREIAEIAKVDQSIVCDWLKKYGIQRSMSVTRKMTLDADGLRVLYIDRRMTQTEIGKMYGVRYATVGKWLRAYGIKKREEYAMVTITPEELRHLYIDKQMPARSIAVRLGCSRQAIEARIIEFGLTLTKAQITERTKRANPRGYERKRTGDGYVFIWQPGHPMCVNGYVLEHRLLAEKAVGRYLTKEEQVHHINMIKLDNRIENLAVLPSRADHHRLHKYMERVAAYLTMPGAIRPEPLAFGLEVFWGGKYVTSIDLIGSREPRSFAELFKATVDAVPEKGKQFIN